MSTVSSSQAEFDFWAFVCCSKCQLPFSLNSGPPVPFWLTECGHVICNNHLNPEQSCIQCGSQNVQLIPLQREMEAPMSEWFRSIPLALDSIAFAAKFQQEMMASQVRYFQSRHHQLRVLVERLKHDVSQLKKSNEALINENEQLRQRVGLDQHTGLGTEGTADVANANGKRQLLSMQKQFDPGSRRPRTGSSPYDNIKQLGPNRLTLPPNQHAHDLPSREEELRAQNAQQNSRPASSRFIEQYAYIPPATPYNQGRNEPKFKFPPIPTKRANVSTNEQQKGIPQMALAGQQEKVSVPGSSRMNSSRGMDVRSHNPRTMPRTLNVAGHSQEMGHPNRRQTNMGPPPTPLPQTLRQAGSNSNPGPGFNSPGRRIVTPANTFSRTRQFVPSAAINQRSGLSGLESSSAAPQRFFSAEG